MVDIGNEISRSRTTSLEIEEEDFDEALGLLDHAPTHSHEEEMKEERNSNRAWKWWVVTLLVVSLWSSYLIKPHKEAAAASATRQYPQFQCPENADDLHPENVRSFEDDFEDEYGKISQRLEKNITEFLENFRSETFDAWDHTYEEVKTAFHDWKYDHYVPYLKNGSAIFESACGIGLNLFMTLEILQEGGVEDLVIYGNEYARESTVVANEVFDRIPPAHAKKGRICTADSTDLSFIPDSSFDLVFCGYISTLLDPLDFETGDLDSDLDKYKALCKSDTWEAQKLIEIAQNRQEAWYARWIGEMARIAKKGAPVIAESVSLPFCQDFYDWGGVPKEFWKEAIHKYDWGVDPNSLEFADDLVFKNRYHVFMKKLEK